MFRFLLHPLLLSLLATIAVWAVVIVYWQSTEKEVSLGDISLYMLGLPLLLIGIGFGIRAVYRRRQASAQEQTAAAGDAQAGTSSSEDAAERGFTLAVLASGIATAAGEDAAAVHTALKAQEVRPAPDDEIKNRDGFPVILSRVADLSFEETEAALLQSNSPPPAMTLRAITLLKKSFAPVADILQSIALDTFAPPKDRSAPPAPLPKLIVDLLVPPIWDTTHRGMVTAVADCLLADTGWPEGARILRTLDTAQCQSALHQIDKFSLEANRSRSLDYYLVLTCESLIDQDVVAGLESRSALFGAATPKGTVPGEAAASVLVRRVVEGAAPAPKALIGRAVRIARGKPIDAAGRIGCDELVGVAKATLEHAKLLPDQVAEVFSDIDHHSGRCAECLGALNTLLPHVDPAEQFIAVGQAFGRLDSAGALVAMAVAADTLEQEEHSVLLISALHATERLAMPLMPPTPAAPA